MTKYILGVVLISLLAACGGQQQQSAGISEDTMLIVRGEQLVGLSISVGSSYRRQIVEEDLTPYEFGVWGSKDPEIEGLETVTVKVAAGEQKIQISRGGAKIIDKSMYFSQGQVRELRVRQ